MFILFFCLSCTKEFNPHHIHFKQENPTRSDKDVMAPKELISKINEMYLHHYRHLKPEDEITDAKLLVSIPRKFLGFNVFLHPSHNDLALTEAKQITFPRGGGYVDLAPIVTGERGSFYLNMNFDWEEMGLESSDIKELKVYFMSNSRHRKINNEDWGSGCNKLFDLSTFFKEKIMRKGLLLNATEQRYLSVLGGTFYFVLLKEGNLYLATATFEDSRYKKHVCRI
ncbi:MAG: hypothetical protein KDD40_04775 [Bdellovibrionales bacterium]|nr:hypothetical protein [Bdellovibrionales bacterium]